MGGIGLAVGTILGVSLLATGAVLLLRSRSLSPLILRFRRSSYWLLMGTGLLIVVGTWVNPIAQPRMFMGLWVATTACLFGLMAISLVELATVRQRTYRELRRLFEQNQEELRLDLAKHLPPRTQPPSLGHSPHENN